SHRRADLRPRSSPNVGLRFALQVRYAISVRYLVPARMTTVSFGKNPSALVWNMYPTQSVDEIASGIGFAAAAGHLDQRARPAFGQRFFQTADRSDLRRAQALSHQLRQMAQPSAKRRAGMLQLLREPLV